MYCRSISFQEYHTLPKWNILCYCKCSLFINIGLSGPQHPLKVKNFLVIVACIFKHIVALTCWYMEGVVVLKTQYKVKSSDTAIVAGSFKSQLIDYFSGHIVSWEAFCRFMLIRNKWLFEHHDVHYDVASCCVHDTTFIFVISVEAGPQKGEEEKRNGSASVEEESKSPRCKKVLQGELYFGRGPEEKKKPRLKSPKKVTISLETNLQ